MSDPMSDPDDSDYENAQNIAVIVRHLRRTRGQIGRRIHTSEYTGLMWVNDILNGHQERCQRNFRMKRLCFLSLCDRLQAYGLVTTEGLGVRETVAIFLYTIAASLSNRQLAERFQRSGSTISVCFHAVLDAVQLLAADMIKPEDPQFNTIPNEIRTSNRYYPFFRNCVGAIDGTHVMAHLPQDRVVSYIGRKGYPTQNILAACSFDLLFTYAVAGWEGTAHDSRIFNSVVHDRSLNFPHPPAGQYYVVDSGFPLCPGYMPPYRTVRYHIPQFRATANQPKSNNEVFNFYHSSLRMAIERTFGIWKKKFNILKNMPTYAFETQVQVVISTMAIHNYIRKYNMGDPDFMAYDDDPDLIPPEYLEEYHEMRGTGIRERAPTERNANIEMSTLRDSIRDELVAAGFH